MLEESRMDKKSSNRSAQPQSRASAIDCKKNSDLTHKPWPRSNKKREGAGSAPKNEPYRRNAQSQKGRGQVDKRPRPRGDTGYAVGGTQSTGLDEDDEPEIGSVFVPGSKKQNLNHLLNFMYPSRGQPEQGLGAGRGPNPQRRQNQHQRPFKHEHDLYLRAYCQFVVKDDGHYKHNLMEPDVPIKWEQIEEVVVRSTGRSECPICLGAPVAGRVGLCGHVYCWPCVLHYAAAHEKQPPPCPVCATSMIVSDMKPTKMVQWDSPTEEVTMRLVRRLRGSTVLELAPPRDRVTEAVAQHMLPLHYINDSPYCKLFSANARQVEDILKREKKEIENQILAEIDTTEIVFMEQALDILKKKKESTLKQEEPKLDYSDDDDDTPIVYEKHETNGNKLDWFDVTDEGAASIEIINQVEELKINSDLNPEAPEFSVDLDNRPAEYPLTEAACMPVKTDTEFELTDIDKQNQAKYFYFYQAEDGQQVFLSSLNVRMLNASWGALAAAPPFVRGRVLHRETLPLSEQTRKHMPCTAHLPLHCSFDIVELELKPPNVTPATMKTFAEELDRRARNRARHEREERRRERAYRRAMEGPPKPDFSSDLVFPPAASFSSPPLDPSPLSMYEQSSPSTSVGSPPSSGLSFAKMASTSGTWRVRKPTSTSPPPPEDDNEESSAPRAISLSDAIEAALHAGPSPSAKKNKKSKAKVLFATGMQRAP